MITVERDIPQFTASRMQPMDAAYTVEPLLHYGNDTVKSR